MPCASRRRIFWSTLSLLAAFALLVPSLAWTCPMVARAASTPAITCPCAAAAKTSQNIVPETAMRKCCRKVPLPDSDTAGDGKRGATLLPSLSNAKIKTSAAPEKFPQEFSPPHFDFVLPAPLDFVPSLRAIILQKSSPPLPFAQHSPPSPFGRSPPF